MERGERQPCYVCSKHPLITEYHHLIPVAQIADYMERTGNYKYPSPMVWLCPNHHEYWHQLETASKRKRITIFKELGDEAGAYIELWQLRVDTLVDFHGVEIPDDLK
jgi:hypothetical protein